MFVAASQSLSTPRPDEDNRSGDNFHFTGNAGNISVLIIPDPREPVATITCDLSWDRSGADRRVATLSNGAVFPGNLVGTDGNHYISNPRGAQHPFVVIFSTPN